MQSIEPEKGALVEIYDFNCVKLSDGIVWEELEHSFKVLNVTTNLYQYFAKTRNRAKHLEVLNEGNAPITVDPSGNWMLAHSSYLTSD
jgi:hypothetical protein